MNVQINEVARRHTAYWAAGHALAASALEVPVARVTIVPGGQALGVCHTLPSGDRVAYTREELMNQLVIALSAAAVYKVFELENVCPASLSSDFRRADAIASRMQNDYGMGKVGDLLDEARRRAEMLVKEKRTSIEALSAALLAEGTLTGERVAEVLGEVQ